MKALESLYIDFGGPATYQIVVQGTLSPDWSDRLAGMTISSDEPSNAVAHTTLVGMIRDQAELKGVLETLYGLHMPILRVEKVDDTQ